MRLKKMGRCQCSSVRTLYMSPMTGLMLLLATAPGLANSEGLERGTSGSVSYTNRSFIINGEPRILLSGAIHYARVPPTDWDMVFKEAKELGLNCIQTYVIWNQHEHKRGEISWDNFANLPLFIDLAKANGLYVVVRIGPYICGEYYFGGLPIWLRSVDNISCFRCDDPIWEREMARWVGIVVDKITPQLVTNGGNVIMLQVENEYGPDDTYLRWAVDMARNLTTEVPWNLCHDVSECGDLNNGTDKVICTINGFWMEVGGGDGQPGPEFFNSLWSKNPNQPAMWTEDQGWFDQWEVAQRVRISSDQIYGIARFFAYGGSYHNFYMLTGGNNYERKSGGSVVTAYAPDTVIDNLFLRHEPRFSFYRSFFQTMQRFEKDLLSTGPATAIPLNASRLLRAPSSESRGKIANGSDVALTTCYQYNDPHQHWSRKPTSGSTFTLTPASDPTKCLVASGANAVLFNCDGNSNQKWMVLGGMQLATVNKFPCSRTWLQGKQCQKCLDSTSNNAIDVRDCDSTNQEFQYHSDTTTITHAGQCVTVNSGPGPQPSGSGAEAHEYGNLVFVSNYLENTTLVVHYSGQDLYLPGETIIMLNRSTKNVVWNSTGHFDNSDSDGNQVSAGSPVEEVSIQNWVWTAEPVGFGSITNEPSESPEQLNITDNDSDYMWYSFNSSAEGPVTVSAEGGTMTYTYIDGVLNNASSGSKEHSFDILSVAMGLYNGGVGPTSTKGISSVKIGSEIKSEFATAWMLKGEHLALPQPDTKYEWSPINTLKNDQGLVWLRGNFDLPDNLQPNNRSQQPNQTAVVLNLAGMNKGVAYVNGFNIGRYYLAPGLEATHPGVSTGEPSDLPPGQCSGMCAPPHHGSHCFLHYKDCGLPTQHLYHIPYAVLKPKANIVVLFEEQTNVQPRNLNHVAVNILHEHPISN